MQIWYATSCNQKCLVCSSASEKKVSFVPVPALVYAKSALVHTGSKKKSQSDILSNSTALIAYSAFIIFQINGQWSKYHITILKTNSLFVCALLWR